MTTSYVVVVGRDVASTLPKVLNAVPDSLGCVVVDDGSRDGTADLVPPVVHLVSHAEPLGYGAAQKSGYRFAIEAGASRLVLLHGDGQYETGAVLRLLDALDEADVALGSRFLCEDGGRVIPWWRRWGNRGLTGLANLRWGLGMSDLHTGARAFRVDALARLPLDDFSDDYVFDQQVLVRLAANQARFTERAVATRYDKEVQSISPWNSVRYGVGCLRTILAARH